MILLRYSCSSNSILAIKDGSMYSASAFSNYSVILFLRPRIEALAYAKLEERHRLLDFVVRNESTGLLLSKSSKDSRECSRWY